MKNQQERIAGCKVCGKSLRLHKGQSRKQAVCSWCKAHAVGRAA